MDAGGAGEGGEAGDDGLDVLLRGLHDVRHLVDDDDDVGMVRGGVGVAAHHLVPGCRTCRGCDGLARVEVDDAARSQTREKSLRRRSISMRAGARWAKTLTVAVE